MTFSFLKNKKIYVLLVLIILLILGFIFSKKNTASNFQKKHLENKIPSLNVLKEHSILNKPQKIIKDKKTAEDKKNINAEKKNNKKVSIKEANNIYKILHKTKTLKEVLLLLKTKNLGLYDKISNSNIFEIMIGLDFKIAKELYIQENIDLGKCPNAIFMACQPIVKSTEPLLFLINEGADLNAKNPDSGVGTPLTNALVSGDKEKVNIILDYVVDITKHDLRGTNALYAASCSIDDVKILDRIVGLGIYYDFKTFINAVTHHNLVVVKHIFKTNPELLDQTDENPSIFECIQESSPEIKKIFADYGINDGS
ncbi:MAG: hypothetical protein RBR08_10560 [Desulforegulaceae bacterium]|nr:hypothetical protein [Desulforegulaceae bacterium]